MADPTVYTRKISAFGRMLRLEGLTVSPQETADACQILVALGLEDRQQVKTALRTVFAKTREEQERFDRVFDGFFVSSEHVLLKPQHEIYEKFFEVFDLKPEECFFIDDNPLNIEGAACCGMAGTVFKGDVDRLKRELLDAGIWFM